MSEQRPGVEIDYEGINRGGSARMLVLLAVIFNFISAGFDILNLVKTVVSVLAMVAMSSSLIAPPPGPAPVPLFASISPWTIQIVIQAGAIILSIATAAIKIFAAESLRRRTRWCWGMGLAGGIVGCIELWNCCCLPITMAGGVYTVVILCLQNVRQFLRQEQLAGGGFPVEGPPSS